MLNLAVFLNTGCTNAGGEQTATAETKKSEYIEVPALMARNGKVGTAQEANKMFNTYESLKATIQNNPNDYASRLKMADLFIVEARATGNYGYYYPAAVEMIDGVLEENPEKPDDKFRALTSKAVILLSYHKFEEARETGRKALAINPHNSRVYGILTDANVEMGDYQQAIKMADSMVAIRPDLRSYSRISYLREIHGDVAGAKEAMQRAITAGAPGHEETVWSRVTLGQLHETYGEIDEAKAQYQAALDSREGYPFALRGLASVAAKKGNYEEAEKLLKQAIENRPDASFYENLALVYEQMDRLDAMNEFRDKAFAELRGLASEGEEHSHSHGEHDHDHGHGHSHDSEHGHSHEVGLEMAKLYVALTDDYEKAQENAEHEYSIRPDNIDVNRVLAYIYLKQNDMEKAQEHFQKASATNSQDPQLMLIGGMIEMEAGNTAQGKSMLKKAFDLNPYQQGAIAKDARERLNGQGAVASL